MKDLGILTIIEFRENLTIRLPDWSAFVTLIKRLSGLSIKRISTQHRRKTGQLFDC